MFQGIYWIRQPTLLMWDLPSHLIVVIVIDYSFHRHRISFQNLSISNYLYLTTFYQMESAKIEFLIILIISWMYSGNNKNDSGLTMAATADFTCAQCTCHVSYSLSACTIVNSCQSLPEKNSWFSTCDILVFLLPDRSLTRPGLDVRGLVAFPRFTSAGRRTRLAWPVNGSWFSWRWSSNISRKLQF